MPIELSDELLDPITADQPAGENLRWLAEWDRIKEARQNDDDGLNAGNWVKKDAKSADWRLVQQLSAALLRTRSKDLQLAMWFTEANVKLRGFSGLHEGLAVARELLNRFWDAGLYPAMEDGPEDRSGPLVWLNEKVVDSILSIPITCSATTDRNYGVLDLHDARSVGSEAQCKDDDGDVSPQKKRQYDKAVADGRVSLDMFESAIKESRRSAYEELYAEFEAAYAEFKELEKVIDEKFGEAAPNLSNLRAAFSEIQQESSNILARKRKEEPSESQTSPANPSSEHSGGLGESSKPSFSLSRAIPLSGKPGAPGAWSEAERMVHSGQVEAGLAEMTRLAASETSGRNRFERKLLLAEVCLATRRERLARAVLEELAEQIDQHKLDTWEGSELISGVWTRLYQLYKQNEPSDSDEAAKLYDRLCRLDPWQALACTE
jgi:type VI secretion system protein ImpA